MLSQIHPRSMSVELKALALGLLSSTLVVRAGRKVRDIYVWIE